VMQNAKIATLIVWGYLVQILGSCTKFFFIVFLTLVRQMQGQTFSYAMTTTCHILTY